MFVRLAHRHTRTLLAALAVLAGWLITASTATAQGTGGTFANPISSKELMDYSRRLQLSESQYLALQSMHDAYQSRFRILRDGDIAVFLRDQRQTQGGIPPMEKVESLLDELDRIQARIKALDESLFDQLMPVLSDEQRAKIPRIRLARERTRHGVLQATVSYGRGIADLSRIVHELNLSTESKLLADPILVPYEQQLTRLMRDLNHAFTRMTLNTMQALEERNLIDVSQEELFADPELLNKVVEEMRGIYAELSAGMVELNTDVNRLNMRTYQRLVQVLPPDEALRLRNRFYRTAYRELTSLVNLAEDDWLPDALALETLTEDERSTIDAANDNWQRHINRLLDRGVDVVDEFWRTFSPYEMNPDRGRAFQADLAALMEEAQEIRDRSRDELDRVLGAEKITSIRRDAARRAAEVSGEAARARAEARSESEEPAPPDEQPGEESFVFSGDRFIPPPITQGDVDRYTSRLTLDDLSSEAVLGLHEAYREQFESIASLLELKAANAELRAIDGRTGDNTEDRAAAVARVLKSRRQAFDDISALDASFFDDLLILVPKEQHRLVEQMRHRRMRRLYMGSADARFAVGDDYSAEASLDLTSIVNEQMERHDLRDAAHELDAILTRHEERAIEALRTRLEAQLELEGLSQQWATEISRAAREDVARVIEVQKEYDRRMKEVTGKVSAADAAVIALNREALAAVVDAAGGEAGKAIRRLYDRKAFPSVYEDGSAVHRQLEAALSLADLTTPQREQIEVLAAEYTTEYERLSREMMKDMGGTPMSAIGMDTDRFKAWMEQQNHLNRLRYDRNELNARIINRLSFVLRPGQIERIGGLPDIEDPGASNPLFRR